MKTENLMLVDYGNVTLNDCSSNNTAWYGDQNYFNNSTHGTAVRRWKENDCDMEASPLQMNFNGMDKLLQKKEDKKMAQNKRGLYQVILIDPKQNKIIANDFVICDKVEDVLLEAGAGEKIKKENLTISEVDKIINFLGEVRKVKKSKDGIVEIVNDEQGK